MAKAEWTGGEASPRFVVTSLGLDRAKTRFLYEDVLYEDVIEYNGRNLGNLSLRKAYSRAGLDQFTRHQHILKHTCCSWLVQAGQSYEAVANLVGTRAQIIERHYGHQSPEHLATIGNTLTIG